MIIDGKKIAEEIKNQLKEKFAGKNLRLAVIQAGNDAATEKFIAQKKNAGEQMAVSVEIYKFPEDIPDDVFAGEVTSVCADTKNHGVIIQLPLPPHIDAQKALNIIPSQKDVDALSDNPAVLSPVVSAASEILHRNGIKLAGKKVVVVGRGRLVGGPVARWAKERGAQVETIDSATACEKVKTLLSNADVIISGVGTPRLITPDMIRRGVALLDFGSAVEGGRIVGDIDSSCEELASIYTPVPGGVGPITVAMLFKNLAELNI